MDTSSQAQAATAAGASSPRVAKKIRLHIDTVERAEYWADREGYPSVNEFMALAVEEKVARMNGDYDLPALEVQRLNQMLDEMRALSTNVTNLESVVVSGFDSLLGLTRGDTYLADAEDGELDDDEPGGSLSAGPAGVASTAGAAEYSTGIDADEFSAGFGGGL